ncbi:MAG: hypothetical protein ACE5NP_12525 [Anaerolineae bacterium]
MTQRKRRKPRPRRRAATRSTATPDLGPSVLSIEVYWRPDPDAAEPDYPGLVLQMVVLYPVPLDAPCPCRSDLTFGDCHNNYKGYFCLDPEDDGVLSPIVVHSVTYPVLDREVVRTALLHDRRWRTVEDSPATLFCRYMGWPRKLKEGRGELSFGTVELRADELYMEAFSFTRFETLHAALMEDAGEALGEPLVTVKTMEDMS